MTRDELITILTAGIRDEDFAAHGRNTEDMADAILDDADEDDAYPDEVRDAIRKDERRFLHQELCNAIHTAMGHDTYYATAGAPGYGASYTCRTCDMTIWSNIQIFTEGDVI